MIPESRQAAYLAKGDVLLSLTPELAESGFETGTLVVQTAVEREVSPKVADLFEVRAGEVPGELAADADDFSWRGAMDGIQRLLRAVAAGHVDSAAIPAAPPTPPQNMWLEPPTEVVELCDQVRTALRAEAIRLTKLLRWYFNRAEPAQPLSNELLLWSLDSEHWYMAPTPPPAAQYVGEYGRYIDADYLRVFQTFLEHEVSEPLARQVLLDAVAAQDDNPRASVVLAVASAEVGLKEFAVSQTPSSSEPWLLMEVASPPLRTLISKYLPLVTDLRTADRTGVIPKPIRRDLNEAVACRNEVVHVGADAPSAEELGRYLSAVNDFLYILDWLSGHDWAFYKLRTETQNEYPTVAEG